jgi:hypothetical protein
MSYFSLLPLDVKNLLVGFIPGARELRYLRACSIDAAYADLVIKDKSLQCIATERITRQYNSCVVMTGRGGFLTLEEAKRVYIDEHRKLYLAQTFYELNYRYIYNAIRDYVLAQK